LLEDRLEHLKTLNQSKDRLNNKIKTQLTNEQIISEALTTFHKPVTEKIEESKQVAIPVHKYKSQAAIEENIIKFEPYQLDDKNINPRLQAKSLVPKFQIKIK